MTSTNPTLAFFGATGGCALAALSFSLEAGYHCSALARTPSKLTTLLLNRGIPQSTLDNLLTIHQGNAKEVASVRTTISTPAPADTIISGIGGAPKMGLKPTLDDPEICQSFTRTLVTAIRELGTGYKPLVCVISTTGLEQKRDIPIAMVPLYHWALSVPHADKKVMEELVIGAESEGLLGGYVIIRPSLLMGEKRNGSAKVKAGYEGRRKMGDGRWGDCGEKVPLGYAITREDVGGFIFEEVIGNVGGEWTGKKVYLTE